MVPQMIATGDDVHAPRKDLLGCLGRNARTAGGVLAISNHQVQTILLAQLRDKLSDRAPPRLAHNIGNEQECHGTTLTPGLPTASEKGWGSLSVLKLDLLEVRNPKSERNPKIPNKTDSYGVCPCRGSKLT